MDSSPRLLLFPKCPAPKKTRIIDPNTPQQELQNVKYRDEVQFLVLLKTHKNVNEELPWKAKNKETDDLWTTAAGYLKSSEAKDS